MGKKLTITYSREDETVPFYSETPEGIADPNIENARLINNDLIEAGVLSIGSIYNPLELLIHDVAAYCEAFGCTEADFPDNMTINAAKSYNDANGITATLTVEDI